VANETRELRLEHEELGLENEEVAIIITILRLEDKELDLKNEELEIGTRELGNCVWNIRNWAW
jgi:hypothetical protein